MLLVPLIPIVPLITNPGQVLAEAATLVLVWLLARWVLEEL